MGAARILNIEDVIELRKAKPTTVPERYIRDVSERQTLDTTLSSTLTEIPIINLSKLMHQHGNQDDFQSEILSLTIACQEWGIFQVVNHGIDPRLLERTAKVTRDFFLLPVEKKQKYAMEPDTTQGYGQAFVFSDDQKLDWVSMYALGVVPDAIRLPHLWTKEPAEFSETVDSYSTEVRKFCIKLQKYIAMSLGLEGDVFEKMFGQAFQGFRMNYYPPCSMPDHVLGLSSHSDGSGFTVLLQEKGSPVGLQILKDNTWISVQPLPDALVVNLGDTIEVLANGRYKSVMHRAVVNSERDRISIATFYSPSYDLEIGPMPQFVDENNPCKYRRYNHGEYSKNYLSKKLEGKSSLDFAKI